MTERIPIKTIQTTFRLIELLVREGEKPLPEISKKLEMPKSTVHDYVISLQKLGYIVKIGKKYRISSRFLDLGESARRKIDIFIPAKTQADHLAEMTGEHVALAIEENGLTVLLYITKGENGLDLGVSEGFRMEMPTNAPGKAILAHLPRNRVDSIIDLHGLPQVTPETITSRKVLFDQFEQIRKQKYATDLGERVEGVRAIASPIIVGDNVRGALAISGPASRMEGTRFKEELPNMLLRATNVVEVENALGR